MRRGEGFKTPFSCDDQTFRLSEPPLQGLNHLWEIIAMKGIM